MKRSSEMFYEPVSPLFLPEIRGEILSKSHSDLVALSCVSKSFNAWTKAYAEKIEQECCFGRAKWKKYKVDVKNVPQIPLKWVKDFDPSKWMLTLVLEDINGKPLTLESIDRFVSDCKNGRTFISNYRVPLADRYIDHRSVRPFKTHWVMLSKDVLGGEDLKNGTRDKYTISQEEMVVKEGYELPTLIDTVVSVLLHNLETGEFVFPDDSNGHMFTYALAREKNKFGHRISVGGFSAFGLFFSLRYKCANVGASCARRSLDIGH